MKILKNISSVLLMLFIVVSFAWLVISPAGAAALNPSSTGFGSATGGAHHHGMVNATAWNERLQTTLTKLSGHGVDVSVPQADLAAGNTTAAFQWLAAYHKDHPELKGNRTAMTGSFRLHSHQDGTGGQDSAGNS